MSSGSSDLGGGASTDLSNLASVAVNTDLSPASDFAQTLGNTHPWGDVKANDFQAYRNVNPLADKATLGQYAAPQTVGGLTNVTGHLSQDYPYSLAITTISDATVDGISTGGLALVTGDKSAPTSTGSTGAINLQTGNQASSTAGQSGGVNISTGTSSYQSGDVLIFSGAGTDKDNGYTGAVHLYTGNTATGAGGAAGSGILGLTTGDTQAGTSGYIQLSTGATSGGTSGDLLLHTGIVFSGAGSSGNITLQTGTVAGGGARGSITFDALMAIMPSGTINPTGVEGGMYYNTSSHALKIYANGAWKTVTIS